MADSPYVQPNGPEIRRRRRDKGLTREELAGDASLHERTIDRLERGEMARPLNVHRVAKALGCRFRDLIIEDSAIRKPLAGQDALPREITFVGREHQLSRLEEMWERTRSGNGNTAFVTGERGIGKTELIRRFVKSVPEDKALRAWVLCPHGGELGEYLPFRLLLQTISAQYPKAYSAIHARYPFWTGTAEMSATVARAAGSSSEIGFEMVQIMTELAYERPLILVFEDIHRASRQALDLIELISRHSHALRMLLICEYRPFEAAIHLKQMIGNLATTHVDTIPLIPLTTEEVTLFLESDFGLRFRVEPWFIADLLDWSGGIPFYIRLRTEGLKRIGAIEATPQGWALRWTRHQIRSFMPEDQLRAVGDFLWAMEESARSVLEVASVEGKYFHARIVALALQIPIDSIETILRALERDHGIVRRLRDRLTSSKVAVREYAFSHGIFRDAVNAQITSERKSILNKSVAGALIAVFGDECNTIADQMAHLFEAGGRFEEAANYYKIAAQTSARGFDDYGGIESARLGLSLLTQIPQSADRNRIELPLQILVAVLSSATLGFSAREAHDAYTRAEILSKMLQDREHLFASLWGLWVYHLVRAEMAIALSRAEDMLGLATRVDDPGELAEAYSAIGLTKLFQGRLPEAVDALHEGISAYGHMTKDPQNLMLRLDPKVACLCMLERALQFMGRPNDAVVRGQEAIDHALKLKQPYSIAFAKMFLSYIHYFRGDMIAAVKHGTEAVQLAESQGLHQVLAWAAVGVHRALGAEDQRRAVSIAEIRTTVQALEHVEARVCCTQFIAMLSELLIQNLDFSDAEHEIERGILISESTGNRDYLAELLRLKGQLMVARNPKDVPRQEIENILDKAAAISLEQGARSQTLRILTTKVVLDAGTQRERQSRQELEDALTSLPSASEQKSGDYVLAWDILRTPLGRRSVTSARGWWLRLLMRH